MNLSSLFIRLPVMTTLVMLGILAVGILGYVKLPVSDLPNVDFPTISVTASLPGANPETMASTVATPLERQFSSIAGIDSMTSASTLGRSQITIQFALNRDIDAAAQDVQSAIAAVQRQLPVGMPSPPSYQKVNPADLPVLILTLHSDVLPLSQVNEYGETMIAQRLSTISGVAQVQIMGTQKYAVRVQVDPDKLAARGISLGEVDQAIDQANVNLPTGTLQGQNRALTVQTNGQFANAVAFRPLIVAYRNGAPVRLEDVAVVSDSVQNNLNASWFKDQRAINLSIQRQPGTNTVEIVDRVRELLPALRSQLPAALELEVLIDRSQTLRESVFDVRATLLLTGVLVVVVIFVFLRRLSATVIPSVSLPMSIIGTFAAMSLLGYSLNNLSLMALTLATGFVVDDAIVMLENIVRRMEEGESPAVATREGSKQISFTVISMTVSLAAVFIPILFMEGMLGRLFREFAVTMIVAIVISGFIALTLIPMLCSRFLRPAQQRHGRLYLACERGFDLLQGGYAWALGLSLRFRRLVALSFLVSLGLTVWLYQQVPKGFIPNEDIGQIVGSTECAQDASFAEVARHQQAVAAIVQQHPDVEAFISTAGGGGTSSTGNQGTIFMRLRHAPARTKTPEQIIDELRKAVAVVPGIRVFFQNPPPIRIGGRLSRGAYQYTLQGTETEPLYAAASDLEKELRKDPDAMDVSSDLQLKSLRLNIQVDRDRASRLGVSMRQIQTTLATAFGSNQVSTISTDTNS